MPYSGKYKIKNSKKYKGNHKNIIYRSLWERKFMEYCDNHPFILEWSSEEISIPYISPTDKKIRRYFPDFVIKKINRHNQIDIIMIEIKPSKQLKKPEMRNVKVSSRNKILKECTAWEINNAKWESAKKFCDKHGWKFKIITEKELNI